MVEEEEEVVDAVVVVAVVEVKEKVVETTSYKTDAFCSHLFCRRTNSQALALFVQLSVLEFIFFGLRYPVLSNDLSSSYTIPKVVAEIIYIYSNMMSRNPIKL